MSVNINIPSLTLIPNQSFIFEPEEPNCRIDNTEYCQLVSFGDTIQIQEYINFDSECYDNIICDTFTGDELVVNGIFYGSTGWEEAGNNWTITSGQACYGGAYGGGILYQSIAGLTEGTTYRLTYTITDYDYGTLKPVLWNTDGTTISANGTYVDYITILPGAVNDDLAFVDTTWSGCISDISLVEVTCWDGESAGSDWALSGDTACHTAGNTTVLATSTSIDATAEDCLYEVSITLTNTTDGSITADINGDNFATISSNGTHKVYVLSLGGTPLTITPTSDFNGCISDVTVKVMCDYPQLALFDLDDNLICYISEDGGTQVDLVQNSITWSFTFSAMECSISYGCYKFKISDPCNDCFTTNNLVTNGTFNTDLSGWTTSGTWAWVGGEANLTTTGSLIQDLGQDQYLCVKFTIISVSETGNTTMQLAIKPNGGGSTSASEAIFTPGTYTLFGYGGRLHFSFITDGTISVNIDDIFAIESDITQSGGCAKYCYQVESNCLNYRVSHDCTKYMKGDCDENSLGFIFDDTINNSNGFFLRERVRTVTFNPSHPKKRIVHLNSDGTKKLIYSESEKTYQLRFDYCDHLTHDTLSTILECDNIEINHGLVDGNPNDFNLVKNYVSLTEDYTPEWDNLGQRNLAQSQVEVREVQSTIFNQNLE